VGCSRSTLDKVSIKEHHLLKYPSVHREDHEDTDEAMNVATNEAVILARLQHECLPRLSEVFVTESSLFLVTNYIDPFRLTNFIDTSAQSTSLNHADVRLVFKNLCSALVHCHLQGVVVRDLTPSNIMFKRSGLDPKTGGAMRVDVVIADLSLAAIVGTKQNLSDHALFEWKMVGYSAPEAIFGDHPVSCAMDCWSLGVLLYVMLSGIEPFYHDDDHVLVQNIRKGSFDFDEDAFDSVENGTKYWISSLLLPEPADRMTAKQLFLQL
jgi:serine/threonine protein kinase